MSGHPPRAARTRPIRAGAWRGGGAGRSTVKRVLVRGARPHREDALNFSEERVGHDGLDEDGRAASVPGDVHLGPEPPPGDDDDRNVAGLCVLLQPAAELGAIDEWEAQISDDDLRLDLA